MSPNRHIYQPSEEDLLRLRAFAGRWGGHDGLIDKSPRFRAKTGHYFRRLLARLWEALAAATPIIPLAPGRYL
jgi:hypothetical protein